MKSIISPSNANLAGAVLGRLKALDIRRPAGFDETCDLLAAGCAQDLPLARSSIFPLLVAAADEEEMNARLMQTLHDWHQMQTMPTLAGIVMMGVEMFCPSLSERDFQALLAAAVLGEISNKLPYHNNLHYRKVLLQVLRMVAAHNRIYKNTARSLGRDQILLLMIAACIHDFGHDGKGNTIKGVWQCGRLERKAVELSLPVLAAAGFADKKAQDRLRVMILCTDVSPMAGGIPTAASQMKAAYRYHFMGFKGRFQTLNLDPDLSALERDEDLVLASLILHEADIATSAGMTYEVTKYETTLLAQEIGADKPRPRQVLDFLNHICQRQMLSIAGQELYGANLARIYALTEEDVRQGNKPYGDSDSF